MPTPSAVVACSIPVEKRGKIWRWDWMNGKITCAILNDANKHSPRVAKKNALNSLRSCIGKSFIKPKSRALHSIAEHMMCWASILRKKVEANVCVYVCSFCSAPRQLSPESHWKCSGFQVGSSSSSLFIRRASAVLRSTVKSFTFMLSLLFSHSQLHTLFSLFGSWQQKHYTHIHTLFRGALKSKQATPLSAISLELTSN